ncbi:type II toxin-antitoxin system RelE/ParE family toxin [Parapedobacter tibetensis]|uniref:type II toxin-antitoxin system RelE/ParE family toxin n=1 Tax=Parapedobacter tibetensis TaxID=2972951 RepID=UPI00214D6909|nr:type II toxin-antitoxin system RelE/ParE family toxin [Parapedobacter tibetensis]
MVDKPARIVWTKMAQGHLKQAFEHISEDSPQNALKVVADIASTIEKAAEYPDAYAPDKLKLENDGTFRAFEISCWLHIVIRREYCEFYESGTPR